METHVTTAALTEARERALAAARATAEQLIKAARELHDAIPPLSAVDENGQSVARLRRSLTFQRQELLSAFGALGLVVGRDYFDLLKFKHRYAAVDGLRFHDDASSAEKCSHLEGEIVRLQKLVDEGKDNI